MDKGKAENFFTPEEEAEIVQAIKSAEKQTSGEIRVHLENQAKEDNLKHAQKVFHQVGMDQTELRNGVLFYLAVQDHQFSIIGDKGINEVTPDDFWDNIRNVMQDHFKKGAFVQGLVSGIGMAGEALKTYFPYQKDDTNELPDQISKS
ncbi:MAG TPA: hypothetical protein DCG19_13330 [Cryomorphaceae bacterium]|nr:hypothetical protein [Owenweeksia sp.]MBG00119.1 hypothetical protein [Owenweeksia sp.]HAD98386.1 hypothetical protein [Cryomorphaceae bacterium]HBF18844.1 hypothetical protein [Cryomorphaceae bacterium]HCQ17042.1 hypothetical protein [Cryomorphaceae bacterium]|tara:strand:- start:668 stop:1111 length:444 start_codon:yes stop_codon:yes gene_type:complete